jgi:proton glutamate symport protein
MKRPSLTTWIMIALVAGIAFGAEFPHAAQQCGLLGTAFLRMIKVIIPLLLFSTLVIGITGTGSLKTMGRIGGKAILYFEIVTTAALFIGLLAVNLIKPGVGVRLAGAPVTGAPRTPTSLELFVEHLIPTSDIEVLHIVVFSLFFGIACAAIGVKARPVVTFCESLAEIMFRLTNYVMLFAPFGVFGAIAATVGTKGIAVLLNLGKLIITLYVAEAVVVFIVFGASAAIARIPIKRFIDYAREPFLIAFSTASSEAALPLALENMESFGVPKHIVAFVLPTGYSFNLVGTTLYLSLASIFIAQAADVAMPIGTQLVMMITLMLTSKGVAGVPRAALVILAGTVASFNLPAEGVALLLGVDTLMDMARTSVNVLGNCLASAVVARWEGVKFNTTDEVGQGRALPLERA